MGTSLNPLQRLQVIEAESAQEMVQILALIRAPIHYKWMTSDNGKHYLWFLSDKLIEIKRVKERARKVNARETS